jgi:hypothetical protein
MQDSIASSVGTDFAKRHHSSRGHLGVQNFKPWDYFQFEQAFAETWIES